MKIKLIILLIICSMPLSLALAQSSSVAPKVKANFFRFNIMRFNTEIDHNETSASPGFQSLSRKFRVAENNFDFILGRELFRHYYISVSPYMIGRLTYGIRADDGATEYEESLQGFGYGAGVSLNINTYINKTRTQFYFAINEVRQEKKYFLRYTNTTIDERSRELETKIESVLRQASFGVRVFNLYNGYTFSLAVHGNGFKVEDFSQSASQGNTEFDLTSNSLFNRENTAYSIEIGGNF